MENFIESKHVTLIEGKELIEDYELYKSPLHVKNKHKALMLRKNTIDKNITLDKSFDERVERINDEEILTQLKEMLEDGFDKVSPLIYLSLEQREKIRKSIYYKRFIDTNVLYSFGDVEELNCYILMEGEMQIFNRKNTLVDVISGMTFFGYNGPIFKERTHTVRIEEESIVGYIPRDAFLDLLCPFSKFSKFISRNILNKDKMFSKLDEFKNYILNSMDSGKIDMENLIELYKKINSCLHVKANNTLDIDYNAWAYSINRLPSNIFTTFAYVLINKIPTFFSTKSEIASEIIKKVPTELRNRDVYQYMEGKSLVIVREMETDVLDFISNLCIHITESKKIRHMLNSPLVIAVLHEAMKKNINTIEPLIENLIPAKLDFKQLKKTLGQEDIAKKLMNIILHYEDYSVSIMKGIMNDKDPIENFIQNLWIEAKNLLGVKSSVDQIDDLVVDIMQGSKRTLINCVSPHIYMNKDKIICWAEKEISEGRLALKTTGYKEEKYTEGNNDLLWAYSYYYYEAFPDENKEKKRLEEEHGIRYITKTFSTGVAVILINPNKFNKEYVDSELEFNVPESKNQLIIHIGYTFGAQSKEIIKPILLLFGSKARSLNLLGKAGGLTGKRKDILISNKIFYDKTNDVTNIEVGDLDISSLEELVNKGSRDKSLTKIHIGPMLTVTGTILQNEILLNYYKLVMGCIGLEMEGYFYAKEIESAIKHMIIKNKFITRCFYYISDLPLDPTQNLASEGEMVNWEEGVQTMNHIQRFVLKQVLNKSK